MPRSTRPASARQLAARQDAYRLDQAARLDRLARAGRLHGRRPDAPEWRMPEGAPAAAREMTASGLHVVRFRPVGALESGA